MGPASKGRAEEEGGKGKGNGKRRGMGEEVEVRGG